MGPDNTTMTEQRDREAEVAARYASATAAERRHIAKLAADLVARLEQLDAWREGIAQEHGSQILDAGLQIALSRVRTVGFEMTEAPRAEAGLDEEAQARARAAGLGPRVQPSWLPVASRPPAETRRPRAAATGDGVVILDGHSNDEEWRAALAAPTLNSV